MATIFYCRVSTQDKQEFDRQIYLIAQRGIVADKTFTEKMTGTTMKRPVWQECFDSLRSGDTLVVESLSRIARSTKALLDVVYELDQRGINLVSLKENVDLSTPTGRMMVGIVSVLAQFERDMLSERITEALAAKKAKGQTLGRPQDEKKREIIRKAVLDENWDGSIAGVAKKLDVNRRTVMRVLAEIDGKEAV